MGRPKNDPTLPRPGRKTPRRREPGAPEDHVAQEAHLSSWIVSQAALGFPVEQRAFREFAGRVAGRNGTELSGGWAELFLRRHPEVTRINGKRMNGPFRSLFFYSFVWCNC